jgi:hypothetical protein
MKIFLSWSGHRSKAIAEAFYQWLPTIIQSLDTWMSDHDVDKGTRGMNAVSTTLEETQFGIICLTPENLNAPWLLFEAGALSKSQDEARVWTFLYSLEYADVQGPLSQFQHTKSNREDIKKLLQAINRASVSSAVTDQQLQISFDRGWPELEEKLRSIPTTVEASAPKRSEREILEEILELVRQQARGADSFTRSSQPGEDFGGGPREMIKVDYACWKCGTPITELPYRPRDPDKLLCRECHRANRPALSTERPRY